MEAEEKPEYSFEELPRLERRVAIHPHSTLIVTAHILGEPLA
jgi:hypothetical protein